MHSSQDPILVEVWRGDLVESVHRGIVALHTGTALERAAGDVHRLVYVRSSAKPFQAAAVVASGAADAFGFSEAQIALACASHSGEPTHVEGVVSMLSKAGISSEFLRCGAHPPMHEESAAALAARGEPPTAIHNNCSGKHAGMLALAKYLGAPLETYTDPDHPAQRLILETVARLAGVPRSALRVAIDGCSAPAPALPLAALASAYALLADPTRAPRDLRGALGRVAAAMAAHPELIAGTGRFDTLIAEATGGSVLAKGGAEGVLGLAVLPLRIGIALKSSDGNARGVYAPAAAILRDLGVLDEASVGPLDRHLQPIIQNHARLEVGTIRVPPGVLAGPPIPARVTEP